MTSSVDPIKGFVEERRFPLSQFLGKEKPAFVEKDTIDAEMHLLSALMDSAPGTLHVVDFERHQVASAAARTLLRRAIVRLTGGEIQDRYLVLDNLGDSEYSVDVMLSGEGLTVVERREEEGPVLVGRVDPAVQETYRLLLSVPDGTAGQVKEHLTLQNVSTATNRLATLAKLGLARRVEQRPAAGGGREFVYVAVR